MIKMLTAASFVLAFLILSQAMAKEGAVIHVVSHDKTKVVTDPSKGNHPYPHWAVFPSRQSEYRKVVLYVTYQCPDSQHCGEWDYIDAIYLRRIGGADSASKNIEIARMISPYGSRFGSTWKFTWHVDITDFAFLLHDSVEVDFNHGGYENNTDRGWLITLDFQLTEGRPAMTCLGMDSLWCGTIPYGDTSKPIAARLRPISFTNRLGADMTRLRILQTGHGMDDSANCAEFCSKWREVFVDDSLLGKRQIWRKCGDNPLFPQAGTWIYDRSNWCPGSIVAPDCYDIAVKANSTHVARMEMEPYINPNHPTANYQLSSYLFYYQKPWAANDVSVVEVIAPSRADEYSRLNPVCNNPVLKIKNSGSQVLKSVVIHFGLIGDTPQVFYWNGSLASQRDTLVSLPGLLTDSAGDRRFWVTLESPNGQLDEYPSDNSDTTAALVPPVYAPQFLLAFHTNHDSAQNSYELDDQFGNIVRERKFLSLAANTTYLDTFQLAPGCYRLKVLDSAGDGLDFWANPEGGYGYSRLLDMSGHLIKAFGSDFGSEIDYSFLVSDGARMPLASDTLPLVNPFPIRNKGLFAVEVFQNEPSDLNIKVLAPDSSTIVFNQDYRRFKEGFLSVDIGAQPDTTYYLKATANGRTITRRIKVKHKD